jgi:hypothetical protein
MQHPYSGTSATLHRCAIVPLALVALLGSSTAIAQDFSVGLAIGADRGHTDCVASFPCDHSSTQWKLTGAYRVAEAIDVQASYFGAGHFQGGDTTPLGTEFGGTFKVDGFGLSGGYRWSFGPRWTGVARAGAALVHTRFDYANGLASGVGKTTLQPLAGLGIAYAITPSLQVGIDYDVTRFKVHTTRGSLKMLGAAAQFAF